MIILKKGQHVTYTVSKDFNHYVYMAENSKITIKSLTNNGTVNINKNIWGPGTLSINANVTMNASIGSAPSQTTINALPKYQYGANNVTETIL